MTETPPDQTVDVQPDAEQQTVDAEPEAEQAGPQEVNCRHCGVPSDVDVAQNPDWLCPFCEHYQDAMACPTCGQTARISLMPAEMAPEVHAPARRRKAKE